MMMKRLLTAVTFAGLVTLGASAVAGAAVERYSLPAYDLPAGCPAFAEQHDRIWDRLVIQQDVNRFHYYEAICEQYFLAAKSPETAAHDYLSKLDFATLTLDLIPFISCDIHAASRESIAWCMEFDRKFPTVSQAHYLIYWQLFHEYGGFPEATVEDIAAARAVPVDHNNCRLERKERGQWLYFKRNLAIKDGRATCIEAPTRDVYPGFSIDPSKTLFRDVDSDGYMDALLIIRSYGGGGSRKTTAPLVVTRKQPGPGPLTKVRFQRRLGDRR